ncbi:MAG: sugar phosphate isomerase/epimerase [Clostridia bacterium]|nr:sugar phosphate isomerase/epimerase [Clostridia bacterium]
MYRTKLCINTEILDEQDISKRLELIKKAGFEGFFTGYSDRLNEYRKYADALGMEYLFIHAPFGNIHKVWENGVEAEKAVNELIECLRGCKKVGVDLAVLHVYKGFEPNSGPNEIGIRNLTRVVDEAETLGVKIAFENTEGDEYLAAVMQAFANRAHVGFCWDTGHEQCYNYSKDMMALYGDRLFCTHINDNLGISRYDGKTFWTDDLHLLPFDGIIDWENIAERLNYHGFCGPLTFELGRKSKPKRHENDLYAKMSDEEYLAQAYTRACRLAVMKLRAQN